jgi:hypothetical protein
MEGGSDVPIPKVSEPSHDDGHDHGVDHGT